MITETEFVKIKVCRGIYHIQIWKYYFELVLERELTTEEVLDALVRINKETNQIKE